LSFIGDQTAQQPVYYSAITRAAADLAKLAPRTLASMGRLCIGPLVMGERIKAEMAAAAAAAQDNNFALALKMATAVAEAQAQLEEAERDSGLRIPGLSTDAPEGP